MRFIRRASPLQEEQQRQDRKQQKARVLRQHRAGRGGRAQEERDRVRPPAELPEEVEARRREERGRHVARDLVAMRQEVRVERVEPECGEAGRLAHRLARPAMDQGAEQQREDHRGEPDLEKRGLRGVHRVLPAAISCAAERVHEQDGHALASHRRARTAVEEAMAVGEVVELVVGERLVEAAQDDQPAHHGQQQRRKEAAQAGGEAHRAGH